MCVGAIIGMKRPLSSVCHADYAMKDMAVSILFFKYQTQCFKRMWMVEMCLFSQVSTTKLSVLNNVLVFFFLQGRLEAYVKRLTTSQKTPTTRQMLLNIFSVSLSPAQA